MSTNTAADALALVGEFDLSFSRADYEALKRAAALLHGDGSGSIRIDLAPRREQRNARAKLERARRTHQLHERHSANLAASDQSESDKNNNVENQTKNDEDEMMNTEDDSHAEEEDEEEEEIDAHDDSIMRDTDDESDHESADRSSETRLYKVTDDDVSPSAEEDDVPMVTDANVSLSLLHQGRCGAYLVTVRGPDGNVPIGVFKPVDEELPPGRKTHWRRGVKVGAAMRKEVAAFRLDHERFCRVPQTLMLRMPVPRRSDSAVVQKLGSFQVFVPHICSAEDMGSAKLCVEEVHKLAALDVRLLNLDRHLGNALVVDDVQPPQRGLGLVPIDHGLCLPSIRECADVWFEWTHFAQCRMPFCPSVASYIMQLDPWSDLETLLSLGLPLSNALSVVFSTKLLQAGVLRNWRIDRIASLCMRSFADLQRPSVLEQWLDVRFCALPV
ncbi:MAG: hypothetical protein MHM6MM_007365 [Cercozoa sp. M6MM]